MNRYLFRAIKDNYNISKGFFFIKILEGIFNGIFPYITIYYSKEVLNAIAERKGWNEIMVLIGWYLGFNLVTLILRAVFNYLGSEQLHVNNKIQLVRNEKIISMDYKYVEDSDVIANRNSLTIRGYNQGAFEQIMPDLSGFIKNILTILIGIILFIPIFQSKSNTFLDSGWMIVAFLIILALSAIIPNIVMTKGTKGIASAMEETNSSNIMFNYIFSQIEDPEKNKEIRIYKQQWYINNWAENNKNPKTGVMRLILGWTKININVKLTTAIIGQIIMWIAYAYIGLKAILGSLDIGSVVASISVLSLLLISIPDLLLVYSVYIKDESALKMHYDYMDLPNQTVKGSLLVEKRLDNEYQIDVEDLSFTYPNAKNPTLKDLNFHFEIGKSYAIVGENGSGKTTFIKLLTRLYQPTDGKITLNDIDIQKYDINEYYSLFNVVFQDFDLFSFKLGETVATKNDVDKEIVEEALVEVGFGDRYKTLKKGLDTSLSKEFDDEGITLSGGELQKLAIARAIVKDGPIYILDEPTAALDPIAEFDIYNQFQRVTKGKTSLLISHRLSSCRFCDEIIVFDEGRIVQKGSHQKLINEEGKYRELWNAQAQYYQEQKVDTKKLGITES